MGLAIEQVNRGDHQETRTMSTPVDDTAAGTTGAGPLARGVDQITRPIRRLFRIAPLTCGFLVVFWTVGALTGALDGPNDELLARIGFGTDSPLWTAFSSALWSMDLLGYVVTTVLLLVFGPLAEREFGALRTAMIFLASHLIGVFLGYGVVLLGSARSAAPTCPTSPCGRASASPPG